MLKLKRTDSTTIANYKNNICVIMSNLKMQEQIKKIDSDLKQTYNNYKYKKNNEKSIFK